MCVKGVTSGPSHRPDAVALMNEPRSDNDCTVKKHRVVPSRFNYAASFKCEKEILLCAIDVDHAFNLKSTISLLEQIGKHTEI